MENLSGEGIVSKNQEYFVQLPIKNFPAPKGRVRVGGIVFMNRTCCEMKRTARAECSRAVPGFHNLPFSAITSFGYLQVKFTCTHLFLCLYFLFFHCEDVRG